MTIIPISSSGEPILKGIELAVPTPFIGEPLSDGPCGPDFSGLSINDGFDPGVTHCAIAMIEPSIHVELFEIWIIEEAAIPEAVASMAESAGRPSSDVVAAPVVVPSWSHPEFAIVTLPREHADQHAVAVTAQIIEHEILHEICRVEILTVAINRVEPLRVVVKDVFEFHKPIFNSGSLSCRDSITTGIVKVEVAIALSWNVISATGTIGRGL